MRQPAARRFRNGGLKAAMTVSIDGNVEAKPRAQAMRGWQAAARRGRH